jgi:hypothetical protein
MHGKHIIAVNAMQCNAVATVGSAPACVQCHVNNNDAVGIRHTPEEAHSEDKQWLAEQYLR